jgi:hypothetical protein
MEQAGAVAVQVAMGIGLAACTGLRAFFPLLVVAVAGRLGWVPLAEPFQWLATWPAIVVFGVAVTTEILSDKIPIIDNLLDTVHVGVKPVAGAVLATAVLSDLAPLEATALGIMAGAPTAGIVHVVKAKTRLVSSVLTAGIGNPILSLLEDVAALIGAIAAIVVPVLIAAMAVLSVAAVYFLVRRLRLRASGA